MCCVCCVCVCVCGDCILFDLDSIELSHELDTCYRTISSKLSPEDYFNWLLPELLDHLSTTDASLARYNHPISYVCFALSSSSYQVFWTGHEDTQVSCCH